MTIQYPEYLWGLLVLLPILVIQVRTYMVARRSLRRLYGGKIPVKLGTIYYVKWFFSSVFFAGSIFFLMLGLSGLNWGSRPVEDNREYLEVMFVVDVSSSMLAEDVSPTRLARSAELMRGVINALPDSRFGVVAFKGEGSTIIPVTENKHAFESLDQLLSPGIITSPWSHIDLGLRAGADAFPRSSSRNQVIVLFSDGENHGGSPFGYAAELSEAGISVATVTVGTQEDATIPVGSNGSPLRDSQDQIVVTRANPELMQQIADTFDGIHVSADEPGSLGDLIVYLETIEQEGVGLRLVEVPRERLLIAVGLLLLMMHELVRIVRWKGVF
ncbi:MAG: vWA domain-containing protein [Spirochaeta sp.]